MGEHDAEGVHLGSRMIGRSLKEATALVGRQVLSMTGRCEKAKGSECVVMHVMLLPLVSGRASGRDEITYSVEPSERPDPQRFCRRFFVSRLPYHPRSRQQDGSPLSALDRIGKSVELHGGIRTCRGQMKTGITTGLARFAARPFGTGSIPAHRAAQTIDHR